MKKFLLLCFGVILPLYIIVLAVNSHAVDVNINAPASVYFSPNGGAQQAIIDKIDQQNVELYVAIYTFTNKAIADAIVRFHTRHPQAPCIVIMDGKYNQGTGSYYSMKDVLCNGGVTVMMDSKHPIMHDKYLLGDKYTVVTGSFNYSNAAETSNGENLLFVRSSQLFTAYKMDWNKHAAHSVAYVCPSGM